ncbi:MAG: zinc-ribbon domain-containing protein [Devosia sp.]
MIISCPHCQTKYQVTYEAIGSAGRKVQCAHCQQAWDQGPIDKDEPPPAVRKAEQAIAEDGLDDAMSAEEKAATAKAAKTAKVDKENAAKLAKADKEKAAKAAKAAAKAKKASPDDDQARGQTAAGKIDPSVIRRRRRAFKRPDLSAMDEQPLARLRLGLRLVGATALIAVLVFAYLGRVQVVQRFPAMAGVYAAMGMGINVVGLEFSDVTSLQTLRNGKEVLLVSAQIVGLSASPMPVPAVVVTLIGPDGQGVYQWSVQPTVRDLMAGERSTFDTQLTLPPGDASRVRLSFASGSGFRPARDISAAAGQTPAAASADHGAPIAAQSGAEHAEPIAADHGEPIHPAAETAAPAEHGDAAAPAHTSPEHH